MKKTALLTIAAIAGLSLAACTPKAADNVTIDNETSLNSEDSTFDGNLSADDTTVGNSDSDALTSDNASSETALNDTALNETAGNTAE